MHLGTGGPNKDLQQDLAFPQTEIRWTSRVDLTCEVTRVEDFRSESIYGKCRRYC